ncbi:MAG: HAD-IB family hydrolase, partial [Acidimicrobiales bacterium]|nr:HAD-IB family hydrolase [Acidimicrobiales bacterium]
AVVGEPFYVTTTDPDAGTRQILDTISDLLPPESQEIRTPTDEELALTYPPGYQGDPTSEAERRPGTDT